MKLNKTRQKLYLDGKVGLINDNNDVEQLREVTNDRDYMGKFTYYHKNRIFPSDAPLDNVQYHPIAWFYEETSDEDFVQQLSDNHHGIKSECTPITNDPNTDLPKVGEWWECIEDVKMNSDDRIEFIKGKKYLCEINSCLTNESNEENHYMEEGNWFIKHFIKSTPPNPTSYKLNIDIPEWVLKAGDAVVSNTLPTSILNHIATPCTTFTLENGTEIELTNNDIDKIKKM